MRLCKLALAMGLVALLSSPALAQQPGRGRGGFGGPGQLLRIEKVQKDLGLDSAAVTKVEEALTKVNQDLRDQRPGQDATPEERAAFQQKMTEATDKALAGALNEKQIKRLHQIQHQQQGVAIFSDEKIQKELNLTDKQKAEIKDINEDLRKDMAELGFGGRGAGGGGKPFDPAAMQENMKKMQGLRNEAMAKATKVLDDKQKGELKNVLGEKLELTMEDMMGAFGRGRGGKPGKPDKPRTDF